MKLRAIAENIWCVRAEQSFVGLHVGTQMTVVRLSDGGLLLHSPVPIASALKAQVDALGPVKHVICPALFHHMHAASAMNAWPAAQLHGSLALQRKRKDLRFDAVLSERPHADWAQDLVAINIEGSLLGETVFYHPATQTLITVDVVENFSHCDHAPTRWYLKLGGIYGRPGWHPLLRLTYLNRKKARASMERILALPFVRVLVAHGDDITENAHQILRDGLRWLL